VVPLNQCFRTKKYILRIMTYIWQYDEMIIKTVKNYKMIVLYLSSFKNQSIEYFSIGKLIIKLNDFIFLMNFLFNLFEWYILLFNWLRLFSNQKWFLGLCLKILYLINILNVLSLFFLHFQHLVGVEGVKVNFGRQVMCCK
jgi:hypothetical protein